MAVKLSPFGPKPQFFDSNGNPLNGGFLYFYVAGSSTPQNTYTTYLGNVANDNPITLNARGECNNQIWFTEDTTYKAVLKTAAGVEIWSSDNLSGINDTSVAQDEWVGGTTPTYISATSFSVTGDQSSTYHIGRRLKSTNTGGTIYSTITAVAYSSVTTVTVANDSGTLDSGLSAVSYSLISGLAVSSLPVGRVTATQLTANQNDYNPTSLSYANVLRISSDASRNITGLQGGTDGRALTIHNVGTFPIVFKYEDTSSTAAYRFSFACTLGGGQSMEISYDGVSSRWRAKHRPEPIGTIKDFGTSTMPEDFLAIDQNVSRTTYASLFNIVGTTWGSGDGSTTFGLYVGKGAALIAAGTGTQTASGTDSDVVIAADTLAVASNTDKWITGMAVVFTLSSGTITGLTSTNTYYVIRNTSTTVKLASTLADAQNGTAIDLTAKSSPVWTITHTYTARTHGDRIGQETHAMSSTELLAHTHNIAYAAALTGAGAGSDISQTGSTDATASTGGNAAMNVMQPSTVVTRGIRYV